MLKTVIFDMDGVLIDSEPIHFESDVNVLKKYNKELSYDFYKQFIGSTMIKIWIAIKENYELEPSLEELMAQADEEKGKIIQEGGYREIKGASSLIKNIDEQGYLLAVASSSPLDYIQDATTAIGVRPYFKEIVSGAELENPKPSPDIFLMTAERLGVSPQECLVIEDSSKGAAAAKAAGMVCVGFINPNSGDQDLSLADYLVESLENIDTSFLEMVYCHSKNQPWKVLETERLVIREISLKDLDELYHLYDNPEILKYVEPLYEREKEEEFLKAYIQNMYVYYGYGLWAVTEKDSKKLIGRIGLSNREVQEKVEVELGYLVGKEYQRKGYAMEACSAVKEFAKKRLYLDKLNIFTRTDNQPSMGLAEKLGFNFVEDVTLEGENYRFYELFL